jgi:D-alanyl-D-alanine carboxypeptidase
MGATRSMAAPSSTFDVAFADALAAAGSNARTPAVRLAPGSYGSLQPPAELVAFGNGSIPSGALASIGDGHSLHAPAARAFQQMEEAARMAGIDLDVVSSYRDLPTQERLAREKGLYSEGGLAATPGTSNHGWGLAVDLTLDDRAQEWMRANAHQFGFVEDVPREPWHWTYRPAT